MTSFEDEFREELRSHFGMREDDARLIAEQGARFKAEMRLDDSPRDLVRRMEMAGHVDPIDRWNVVVDVLYADSEPIADEESTNPYQL